MKRQVGRNGPTLVADEKTGAPKLIYRDGFFLLGRSMHQLETQIAADCGLSVRTVRRHLHLAEERGWIERIETEEGVGIRFDIPEVEP
jgi:predicted transcriptional regulator